AIRRALRDSKKLEQEVVQKLEAETKHQGLIDKALDEMTRINGPNDPPLSEKDPLKRAEERKRERERVCKGSEETRNCILWQQIEPVDIESKALDVEIAKRRRILTDAELRNKKADAKANPKFDPGNLIASIVGPFQIQQVVLNWIEYDREVDKE